MSERDAWEEDARRYCANATYWRDRCEKAEAEIAALKAWRAEAQAIASETIRHAAMYMGERDKALAERDALRVEEDDMHAVLNRLSDILTRAVEVIKGPPPELTMWGWHDLPELVDALKAERDALLAERDGATAEVKRLRIELADNLADHEWLRQAVCDCIETAMDVGEYVMLDVDRFRSVAALAAGEEQ